MDTSNTPIHDDSIQFIYLQRIQICNTLSWQFYDTLQFILLGKFITMFDDG